MGRVNFIFSLKPETYDKITSISSPIADKDTMPSYEFVCLECKCEWVVADFEDKFDVSYVVCVECRSKKVELCAFSQTNSPEIIELQRRIEDLQLRIELLEQEYEDEDVDVFKN